MGVALRTHPAEQPKKDLYDGREQTLVKHRILQQYLLRLALIVGRKWPNIAYVDGFSGPWQEKSEALEDTSFSIALRELKKAREKLASENIPLSFRCFFVEIEPEPYSRLRAFAEQVTDARVETRNASFESVISEVERFVRDEGPRTFPFIFIDPTGWTGFGMRSIRPLLRLNPGEVMINFMTRHIRRFIEDAETTARGDFEELFGSADYKDRILGLRREDRDDAAVDFYRESVKVNGNYPFVCTAVVLHPLEESAHFHLIYATRNLKGVEVFKAAERRAMEEMERRRAGAQVRAKEARTGQANLFADGGLPPSTYYDDLRTRYLGRAQEAVRRHLRAQRRARYEEVWALAAEFPLAWEQDLRGWVEEWEEQGTLAIKGLKPRHVPKIGEGITLEWLRN